ncbi:unnamed protein product [Caenorhabditis nigoni]
MSTNSKEKKSKPTNENPQKETKKIEKKNAKNKKKWDGKPDKNAPKVPENVLEEWKKDKNQSISWTKEKAENGEIENEGLICYRYGEHHMIVKHTPVRFTLQRINAPRTTRLVSAMHDANIYPTTRRCDYHHEITEDIPSSPPKDNEKSEDVKKNSNDKKPVQSNYVSSQFNNSSDYLTGKKGSSDEKKK